MGEISARDAVEMADAVADVEDDAALVELLLRGCAYVASNETIEDGRAFHVAEGTVHDMVERLDALRSKLERCGAGQRESVPAFSDCSPNAGRD